MNDSERLKELRKALNNMKQGEFAKRISTTQGHISDIENGRKGISARTAKIICSEFNVNETWLRTGEGEMFIQPETFSLDEYAKEKGLTPLEFGLLKAYMNIDAETREKLLMHFKSVFDKEGEMAVAKENKKGLSQSGTDNVINIAHGNQINPVESAN